MLAQTQSLTSLPAPSSRASVPLPRTQLWAHTWRTVAPAPFHQSTSRGRERCTCRAGPSRPLQSRDADCSVSVGPITIPPAVVNAPWYFKGPGVLLLAGLLLAGVRRVRRKGSLSGLESRGYLDQDRGNKDPYDDMMKGVRLIEMEELTEDQILAARKRRSKEHMATKKVDLEEVQLPDNHPFAVKKKVSQAEEELIKQRLQVRRGAPLADLSGKRGYPTDT